MNGCKFCGLFLLNVLIFAIALFVAGACFHDNAITRRRCEEMGASIAEMIKEQERQNANIRQIKTDSEIVLRLAAGGEFVEDGRK